MIGGASPQLQINCFPVSARLYINAAAFGDDDECRPVSWLATGSAGALQTYELTTWTLLPIQVPCHTNDALIVLFGLRQVFLEEENNVGRYKLVAERSARPAGEDLDDIIMGLTGDNPNEDGAPFSSSSHFVLSIVVNCLRHLWTWQLARTVVIYLDLMQHTCFAEASPY